MSDHTSYRVIKPALLATTQKNSTTQPPLIHFQEEIETETVYSSNWTPDEITQRLGMSERISWTEDKAGRDGRSSHERLMRFLLKDNGLNIQIFLSKRSQPDTPKRQLFSEGKEFFEARGIHYRETIDIKNYLYGMERKYKRAKEKYLSQPSLLSRQLNKIQDRTQLKSRFEELLENECPGFWILYKYKYETFKDSLFTSVVNNRILPNTNQNDPVEPIDNILEVESNLLSSTIPLVEERNKRKSNSIDFRDQKKLHSELNRREREIFLKERELDIREREIAHRENELLFQKSEDIKRERLAKIRRIELENLKLEKELNQS